MTSNFEEQLLDTVERDINEIESLKAQLKAKDQEIAELKAKLQGSCEGCEYEDFDDEDICNCNDTRLCSRAYTDVNIAKLHNAPDHYTPKENT